MRDTAGSAAAPAARCKNWRRGSFMESSHLPIAIIGSSVRPVSRTALTKIYRSMRWKKGRKADDPRDSRIGIYAIDERCHADTTSSPRNQFQLRPDRNDRQGG